MSYLTFLLLPLPPPPSCFSYLFHPVAQSPRWDKVVEGRGNGWTAKVDTWQGSQVAQSSEEAQGLPEDDQVSR